ncbi:MAG TPA: mechanosensitive ion channel family protein [Candidatus Methylomirabilis sp.]|nr:mechanosensitive ion channel family protein [Candidatus Methylomirabilis sp.]
MRRIVIPCLILFCLFRALPVSAQAPAASPAPAPSQSLAEDPLGRSTPRGAVLGFIKAAQEQDYARAAQYLDARQGSKLAEELAQQLKLVLDRGLSAVDIDVLSAKPEGNLEDGLPPNQERVGKVNLGSEKLDILLSRVQRGKESPIWLLSAETLRGIPQIYDEVRPPWIEGVMWTPLREIRFLHYALWEWLVLLIAIPLVIGAARLLTYVLLLVLRRALYRLTGEREDRRLETIAGPIRLLAVALVIIGGTSLIGLPLLARYYWTRVAGVLIILAVTWLALRLIDVAAEVVTLHLQRINRGDQIALARLLRRLTSATAIILAGLALLYLANVNLTAALAGLGIGGLALAFAAQKTLENLFGGILIISDQPVHVGDFCRVGDYSGTVEDIGLRSTRIRTPSRTLVSVPNGQMAALSVENFAARDKIWFHHTIGVRYETSADQLRYLLAEVRGMLYAHPRVESDSAWVRFARFGASSLDLEIFAYVLTGEYATFLEIQEDLLLRCMEIIEGSGTRIAMPSHTSYVANDPGLDAEKGRAAIARVQRWRQDRELPFPNFAPERIAGMKNSLEYPVAESALRGATIQK